MNLRRVMAVAGRLMRQLILDRRASALIFIAPLVIMTLLAVVLKSDENPPKVAVSATGDTLQFVGELEALLEEPDEEGEGFSIVDLPEDMSPQGAVGSGLVDAVLIFPATFIDDRASGKRSDLTLYVEGANPMRTAMIFSRFRKIIPDSMAGLPKFLPLDCDAHCAETIPEGPPKMAIVKRYGEEIEETMDFFTPVLPPFFVFFFVFLLSGLSFLRERIGGTAERILASPLTRAELVSGYVLGFLPAALAQSLVVILFARFMLGGPWGGWVAVIVVFLLCLVAECLGVFISAFARSEFQVFQFIPIIILPQVLLCGIIWPISGFPSWLKAVAYCFPLRDSAKIKSTKITCFN